MGRFICSWYLFNSKLQFLFILSYHLIQHQHLTAASTFQRWMQASALETISLNSWSLGGAMSGDDQRSLCSLCSYHRLCHISRLHQESWGWIAEYLAFSHGCVLECKHPKPSIWPKILTVSLEILCRAPSIAKVAQMSLQMFSVAYRIFVFWSKTWQVCFQSRKKYFWKVCGGEGGAIFKAEMGI